MKNTFRITLLLAAVALIGDTTLRQLPEKILANLSHSASGAGERTAGRFVTMAEIARPFSR